MHRGGEVKRGMEQGQREAERGKGGVERGIDGCRVTQRQRGLYRCREGCIGVEKGREEQRGVERGGEG